MSFSPYTNDHRSSEQGKVLGVFREEDHGHFFEFAERYGYPADYHPEMPHVIFVGHGETRLAHVKKTVMTMVNCDGVTEKWMIKGHRIY